MPTFKVPAPQAQIMLASQLFEFRNIFLQEALRKTVSQMDRRQIGKELAQYVPAKYLKIVIQFDLPGEFVFSVPCVLEKNPYLIAYYRLLLGISQKEFYRTKTGLSRFKSMEDKGVLSSRQKEELTDLAGELIRSSCALVDGLKNQGISRELLDDLTLLLVGAQFRGGANVKKGGAAIKAVFDVIRSIVGHAATSSSSNQIEITNAAGRKVSIIVAADPDIVIREIMEDDNPLYVIAIEVKGGTDSSNIHNRIGEAEKSHLKARAAGYRECWTVINVDDIDLETARKESKATDRFYRLSDLVKGKGSGFEDFKSRLISLTSIRSS